MKEDNPITDIADAATTNVEAPAADKAKPVDEKPVDEKADETPTADESPSEPASDGAPSLRTIIRQQAIEDELPLSKNLTLKKVLGGDILNTQFLRRQIWVILIASLFVIVYISNRYKCQQNLIKIDKLTNELEDAKYRALSSSSDLTQQTRESKVLERLHNDKDSTLHIATQPPYIITIPNNE